MVGPCASGKSTLLEQVPDYKVVASDDMRERVTDDPHGMWGNEESFALFNMMVDTRLMHGLTVFSDATNLKKKHRVRVIEVAEKHGREIHYIVCVPPSNSETHKEINRNREYPVPDHILDRHRETFAGNTWREIEEEAEEHGIIVHEVALLDSTPVDIVEVPREYSCNPNGYDVVADVHGCYVQTVALIRQLGWKWEPGTGWYHPEGRGLRFLGDLTDRGPESKQVLDLMMYGFAPEADVRSVQGNHCNKLARGFRGNPVQMSAEMLVTWEQIKEGPEYGHYLESMPLREVIQATESFDRDMPVLYVTHAALPYNLRQAPDRVVREYCLYGQVERVKGEDGYPVRSREWMDGWTTPGDYIVVGHEVVPEPVWRENALMLDGGAHAGGPLRALRFPEMEIVDVQ